MSEIRERVTYANVASTLALFVLLSTGSAYATTELAANSVGTRELRPVAVTAGKLADKAVTTPKIKAIAIKQGKIASAAVTGAKIAEGSVSAEKIAKGAVTGEKFSEALLTAAKIDEATLGQVPSANVADSAGFAESSNPEAFARVSSEAVVSPSFSKAIEAADVKAGPEPGIYCVEVPGFVPRGAQAIPQYAGNNDVSVYVRVGGTSACLYPKVEVQTYNNGSRQKEPFYFVAYR